MHLFLETIKKHMARMKKHSSAIETSRQEWKDASFSRFIFPVEARRGEARPSKPAVCNQSSQVGRPTTGIDPPVVERGLRSDGCQHARDESEVQGSSERDRRRVGKCDAKTKGRRGGEGFHRTT